MKLFIKILLFVLVALIANVKMMSATTKFSNVQKSTVYVSFHTDIAKQLTESMKIIWQMLPKWAGFSRL